MMAWPQELRLEFDVFVQGVSGWTPMPKYTVTIDEGNGPERSGEALEFANEKAATDDAQIALAEMARDHMPDGKSAQYGIQLKDDTGNEVYKADLRFSAKDRHDIDREEVEVDIAAVEVAKQRDGSGPQK